MSGFYRMRWQAPSSTRSFSVNSILQKPGNLYLEFTDILGRSALILTITPDRVTVTMPRDRLFFQGAGGAATIEHIFSLPLDADVILSLLMGQFVSERFRLDSLQSNSGRHIEVQGYAQRRELSYRFMLDPKFPAVMSGTLAFPPDDRAMHVAYSHFFRKGAFVLPRRIHLAWNNSTEIVLRAVHLELNQPFQPEIFSPHVPSGYRLLPIEELHSIFPFPGIAQ